MVNRPYKKSLLSFSLFSLFVLGYVSYFGYHLLHKRYDPDHEKSAVSQESHLVAELAALKEERARLEHKITLLRTGTLDADIIDEYARRQLNFVRENEIMLMRPNTDQTP